MTLVNSIGDMCKKLIVPGIWIIENFGSFLVEIHGEVAEKIDLTIGGRFLEHLGSFGKLTNMFFNMSLLYIMYQKLQAIISLLYDI